MTGILLGDPINLLIALFAMSFLFLAGVQCGRWSTTKGPQRKTAYEAQPGNGGVRTADCVRCAEISQSAPLDLIYFWNPGREATAEDGERVRTMALAMHAETGHLS